MALRAGLSSPSGGGSGGEFLADGDTQHDQCRADECRNRDTLVEGYRRGDQCYDGVEVQVVAGVDRPDAGYGGIPGPVAGERGYEPEKQQIADYGRA